MATLSAEMIDLRTVGPKAIFDVRGAETGVAQAVFEMGAWTGASAGVNDAQIRLYRSADGASKDGDSVLATLTATARISGELDLGGTPYLIARIDLGDNQSAEGYVTLRITTKNPFADAADPVRSGGGIGSGPLSAGFGEVQGGGAPANGFSDG